MFVCPETLITPDGTLNFPLPHVAAESKFNYPNSQGLSYEAQEIRECIKNGNSNKLFCRNLRKVGKHPIFTCIYLTGLKESPKLPLRESILIADIMEAARTQLGVFYEQD